MEEEYLDYDESLGLQEIGFDEPCFAYYITDEISDKKFFRFRGMEEDFRRRNSSFKTLPGLICAPLYQQAFKWFRKNHDLRNWIESIDTNHKAVIVNHYGEMFNTYEEAELACLKKLIKIVKEKK